jgi:hypothetical protein
MKKYSYSIDSMRYSTFLTIAKRITEKKYNDEAEKALYMGVNTHRLHDLSDFLNLIEADIASNAGVYTYSLIGPTKWTLNDDDVKDIKILLAVGPHDLEVKFDEWYVEARKKAIALDTFNNLGS